MTYTQQMLDNKKDAFFHLNYPTISANIQTMMPKTIIGLTPELIHTAAGKTATQLLKAYMIRNIRLQQGIRLKL